MDAKTLELLAGKEFNEILAGDHILKELEKARYNSESEKQLLMEVLQLGDYRIGNLPVRPLTVAKWAFLWMLESPFVIGGTAEIQDWDIFLYVLAQLDLRQISCSLDEITRDSQDYALATGLDAESLAAEIKSVIKNAFFPFEMFPAKSTGNSGESCMYDGFWASFMAGIAAKESNTRFDYCLHDMSLAAVCALVVNWQRRESMDGDKICRNMPQDIEQQITARIDVLAVEYISQKAQIKKP